MLKPIQWTLLTCLLITATPAIAQDQPPPAREREARRSEQRRVERRQEQEQHQKPRTDRSRSAADSSQETDQGQRTARHERTADRPPPPATPAGEPAQVGVVVLKHAMASDVIKVVERVFAGAPMRAAVDERTNSLVLSGPDKGTLEHARALLSELDRPLEAPDGAGDYAVQSVVLKAADAREVSDHLEEIAPRTRGPSQVRFVADARANTVWVAGSEKSVGKFVALANEMDATTVAVQGALAEGRPELHFHKLQHADARMVCGTINQVMKTMAVDVEVVPDAAANMLIAFAGSTEQDLITRIISELDIQAARQTRRGARGNLESTESDKSE